MKVCLEWVKDFVAFKTKPSALVNDLTMCGLEAHLSSDNFAAGLTVFETEVTSNRADWLSHLGVAREVAAIYGGKLKHPEVQFAKKTQTWGQSSERIGVQIKDTKRCPYYSCIVLEGVKDEPSPKFMQDRLIACGLRPVSLIVDVTNYVLLEMGQPLHAFDLDLLEGREIIVRTARPDERIKAIDGREYELKAEDLVIADQSHPIALAGVMGGMESQFGEKTKNVLLESAYFQPRSVRITSRRLALTSESSYRFERGVDPLFVDEARDRAVYLIAKYGSLHKVSRVYKAGKINLKPRKVLLDIPEMDRILGVSIAENKAKKILENLTLRVKRKSKGKLEVGIPSCRPDLTRSIDLVEEITRIYGYDRIPETIPAGALVTPLEKKMLGVENKVRDVLAGAGFYETVSFSLENETLLSSLGLLVRDATTLVNPQNKELTILRPSLLPGLLRSFTLNAERGRESIRLFEIAHAYGSEVGKPLPSEDTHVGMLLSGKWDTGWGGSNRASGFFDLKGVLETLFSAIKISAYSFRPVSHKLLKEGEAVEICVEGKSVGLLGTLGRAPQTVFGYKEQGWIAELNLTELLPFIGKAVKYTQPSRFPSAKRDIALIVKNEISSRAISDQIRSTGQNVIRHVSVFDVFQGGSIPKDSRSIAFSIEYGSDDRTLTSDEVNELHKRIGSVLKETYQAQIR